MISPEAPSGNDEPGRAQPARAITSRAAVRRREEIADRAERVVIQIKRRLAGEPNPTRLVSMFDPDPGPVRRGKLGEPDEFG